MPQPALHPVFGPGFTPRAAEPWVRRANLLLIAGPGVLLLGALAFQRLGGLAPCEMCVWQRWAHAAALGTALAAGALRGGPRRALLALAAAAVLVGAGIAGLHTGVEQGWWEGPTQCAATGATGSAADFTTAMMGMPLVRCDAVPWALAGISMAGWNLLFSMLIGAGALWLLWRRS